MKARNTIYKWALVSVIFISILVIFPSVSADVDFHLPKLNFWLTPVTSSSQVSNYTGSELYDFYKGSTVGPNGEMLTCHINGQDTQCGFLRCNINPDPDWPFFSNPWEYSLSYGDGTPTNTCNLIDGCTDHRGLCEHFYTQPGTFPVTINYQASKGGPIVTKQFYVTFTKSNFVPPSSPVVPTPTQPTYPAPVASFNKQPSSGISPMTVQFSDTSLGRIVSYRWNFGDDQVSTDKNPSHTFFVRDGELSSSYLVTLTVTDGYGREDISYSNVAVYQKIHTNFIADPDSGAVPLEVSFTDLTPDASRADTYIWNFGDGTIENWVCDGRWYLDTGDSQDGPPVYRQHTYTQRGVYTATLTIKTYNGPPFIASKKIKVGEFGIEINPDFSATPTTVQSGSTVKFTDLSTCNNNVPCTISEWDWDFGDGTYSYEQNPTHTYHRTGPKTVKLTVGDGLFYSDTKEKTGYISVEGENLYIVEKGVTKTPIQMGEQYTIYVVIKNPTDEDIPDFTLSSIEIPGGNYQDDIIIPEIEAKHDLPIPKTIRAGQSERFEYTYYHHWRWLKWFEDTFNNPISPKTGLFTSLVYVAIKDKIPFPTIYPIIGSMYPEFSITAGGVISSGVTIGINLITALQADKLHSYSYTFSPSQTVSYLDPIFLTVGPKQDKVDNILGAWAIGAVAGGTATLAVSAAGASGGTAIPGTAYVLVGISAPLFVQANLCMLHAIDPDMDYQKFVIKERIDIPEINEIPETPSKEAVYDSIALLEDTNAYMKTLNKYDAAKMYEDKEWMLIHQNMASIYAKNIADDYVKLNQSTKILFNEMVAENISVTDESIQQAKIKLTQDGFPDLEYRILKRMGYSDNDIKELANQTATGLSSEYVKNYDTSIIQSYDMLNGVYSNESIYFASEVANSSISTYIQLDPDVFDRNGTDTYLNSYVEIPNQDVSLVNISTVKLNGIPALNDTSYSFVANPEILDRDSNGNPEIRIVFDKESIQSVLAKGENDVTVTGQINDIFFVGTGYITVYTTSTPATKFTANITSGDAPLAAAFTSTCSGYPDRWIWDFGDGDTSYDENPVHIYTTTGTYNVTLKVINDHGVYAEEKTDFISVLSSITPSANFTADAVSATGTVIMNFTDQSANSPTKWSWEFGDGANSTEHNPSHAYTSAGNYTVSLEVRNNFGEDKTYRLLTVPDVTNIPFANFTASQVTGKSPLTITFNDSSVNATSWLWDFGDGTNSTEQNPVTTYAYAGNYTVKLTASNSEGSDTLFATDFITVLQPVPPIANFTADPRSGLSPLTVTFNDTSDGDSITLWYWTFGDGSTSSLQNPEHTYQTAGNYSVSLEIANSVGSNTTMRIEYINVSSPPVTTPLTPIPTTTVTTVPMTTKPIPTKTQAPLSLPVVFIGIFVVGVLSISKNQNKH